MTRALLLLLSLLSSASAQFELGLDVRLTFAERPLAFDTLALDAPAGRRIAVTRCDLLLSGLQLQRADGTWVGPGEWYAYVNGRAGNSTLRLPGIPAGAYQRLRFQVGLPVAVDRGDPARHPAGHPLNPAVNGMHWGWQGGYVFAAIEGRWRDAQGAVRGYSYHLAGEAMPVELPLALDLSGDRAATLALDLKTLFEGLTISAENAATHSREGDLLARQLRLQMTRAFRVETSARRLPAPPPSAAAPPLIAPGATPFRLSFPRDFPMPALPRDNPLTNEGVALGERLFSDVRLSGNQTQSCASCHQPALGFRDARRFSLGAEGQLGTRRAMPLLNLAWKDSYFWDGRAASLRAQALVPIQDPREMHADLPTVVARLGDEYREDFARAFGSTAIDAERVGRALEQYMLSRVSANSRFDRAQREEVGLSGEEQRGFALFNMEYDPVHGRRGADCFHCHGGALFRSAAYANNGLDLAPPDEGRAGITHAAADRGKFAVPSLRNVALNAPYMHDGRFATLEEVVAHYDHGVARSETLDPNLAKHPAAGLGLSESDQHALAAFLRTLTDERFLPKVP